MIFLVNLDILVNDRDDRLMKAFSFPNNKLRIADSAQL